MAVPIHTVANTGFTTLHDSPDAIVDIIFVHGLQGHPKKTWTSASDQAPSQSSTRKLLFRSQQRTAPPLPLNAEPVFWPRDFVKEDHPRTRILTFGYDSQVSNFAKGSANQSNIFGHAKNLLYALSNLRRDCRSRPIVFIAHSLGGIIVKEVLRRSDGDQMEDIRNVVLSTAGVIFMGTPHRGSKYADLGEVLRRIASAVGFDTSDQNIRALAFDSIELELSREEFLKLWNKYGFEVRTFQESTGLKALRGFTEKVVPDFSSSMDDARERPQHVPGNHRTMCCFNSKGDQGYIQVSGELTSIIETVRRVAAHRTVNRLEHQAQTSGVGEEQQALLKSLSFPEMHNRHRHISRPMHSTCQWIRKNPHFGNFQDGRSSLLWIKGPAGSGKSVLMKHLLDEARLGNPNLPIASFFFSAAGSRLEHNPEGMYRSLAHQVLSQNEDLLASLVHSRSGHPSSFLQDGQIAWDMDSLRELWSQMTRSARWKSCTLFIDALDECEQDVVRQMIYDLETIMELFASNESQALRVMFSSRHYPSISVERSLEIFAEQFNSTDIHSYVSQSLSRLEYFEQSALVTAVTQKASGLFLWASLVVNMLIKASEDGESLGRRLQLIEELPEQMEALCTGILSSLSRREKKETFNLLKWITFSARRMTVSELLFAINLDDDLNLASTEEWETSSHYIASTPQLLKLLRSRSRGLVEFRYLNKAGESAVDSSTATVISNTGFSFSDGSVINSSPANTSLEMKDISTFSADSNSIWSLQVDLIHMCIRDFLIVSGLSMLSWTSPSAIVPYCHELIAQSCLHYLELPSLIGLVSKTSCSYAQNNSSSGDTQLWQTGQTESITGNTVDSDILDPLLSLEGSSQFELDSVFDSFPLLRYSVDYLFHHFEVAESCGETHTWLAKHLIAQIPDFLCVWRMYVPVSILGEADTHDLLQIATLANLGTCVDEILSWRLTKPSLKGYFDLDKSLYLAALRLNNDVALQLISAGAHPAKSNGLGRTTLHILCRNGSLSLIEACADYQQHLTMDVKDAFGQTPLHDASEAGHKTVVSKLVALGANKEAVSRDAETPLMAAARRGRLSVVKLLVNQGATVDAQDSSGRTALDIALEQSHEDVYKFLHSCGAAKRVTLKREAGIDWRGASTPAPPEHHIRSRDRGPDHLFDGSLLDLLTHPYGKLGVAAMRTVHFRKMSHRCAYCGDVKHVIEHCPDFLSDKRGCILEVLTVDSTYSNREQYLIYAARQENRCEYCFSRIHSWSTCTARILRLMVRENVLRYGIQGSYTSEDDELIRDRLIQIKRQRSGDEEDFEHRHVYLRK